MIDETLTKFKDAVDEEIKVYEEMESLYKLKQSVLVQCKTDELWDVDAKIVSKINNIKALSSKRKQVGKYLGNENITMSEVIQKAMDSNKTLAKKLEEQKTKLNLLTTTITLYETSNLELIKHGMNVTERRLNIIFNTLAPHANQYDNSGKNTGSGDLKISSVVEEA